MPKDQHLESILNQGKEREKEYNWLEAAELYEQASGVVGKKDLLKKAEIQERIGYCLYRAAFQAEAQVEFENRMRETAEAYEKTVELFKGIEETKRSSAKILHCRATVAYIGYWLSRDGDTKRESLDECWRLEKEALKILDEVEDRLGSAKTCVRLMNCLADRFDLELDTLMREKIIDEALSLGNKAIQIFSKAKDEHELAGAYCITSIHCINAAMSSQLERKRRECKQKAFDFAKEAIRISKRIGDKFLQSRSTVWLGTAEHDLGAGSEVASELFRKAIQYSSETKDHRIESEAFDGLAFSTAWTMTFEEDLKKMREKSRKCEEYTSKAIRHSVLVNYSRGIPHSHSHGYVANLKQLARREIELETRHKSLEKAVAFGKQGLKHAQRTGSTHAIMHVLVELAHALYYLSTMKTEIKRRQLLEEAMTLGEKAVYYTQQLRPGFVLPQVFPVEALALTLLELSKLEESREKRKELLEKSVSRMDTGISLLQRHVTSFPSRRELFAFLGSFQMEFGNIVNQLYQTTTKKEVLRKLIETYQSAIQMNRKADLVSRVAEAYWQIAVAYDRLVEYLESASNFESASKQYELSARNIPQLNGFYVDHALYMHAWSEIEKAKNYHTEKQYGLAREHYEEAANLHKSTRRWNHLSTNYLALALVEEAEDLSRREQAEEAKDIFQRAAELFVEAEKSIRAKLEEIESKDEKEMLVNLAKASDIRREYSLGRIALEEAKILDRKGDHTGSSRKYGFAAERFQKAIDAVEHESDRQELMPIVLLSQAWQMMTRAEAEASPRLYLEASQLFDEAKEHSFDEKAKVLALGHSRFCLALEAGTKFEDTRDATLHSSATRHLESASNYYLKAGFKTASEYAKATHMLFDAYVYTHKAETETEPRKKAQYYQMAEKLFQASAGSFMKAKHPEKSEQVQRILESVKEKRQLAISLIEVLHAPTTVSTTSSFSTPTTTHEQAVGLDRFEHADIQANLLFRAKEVTVGEDVDFRLELVNAGKAPALLIKVDEIVPEGFEVKGAPEVYAVEDRYLNMKGRRLNPLKTEDVKIVARPRFKGKHIVKPRVLYIDDAGKYKSHDPEPVTITVRELGIKGWIKGER